MGKVIIQPHTTKNPITLIGEEAGICYGADITNEIRNYKRGLDCIESNHGRTLEYPQVYMIFEGYSARVLREYYTHIGGAPTRLQASTRYIGYSDFDYIIPPDIEKNPEAKEIYEECMHKIATARVRLATECGISKEDSANLLPLGMESRMVVRTNLRNLMDMDLVRSCSRAYWEIQNLMRDIKKALSEYSDEWNYLVKNHFKTKCDITQSCQEKKSCGRYEKKN